MKSCYFCHLPVGDQLTAEVLIQYSESINGGKTLTTRYPAHITCCEFARRFIESGVTLSEVKAQPFPFPFTFKP